MGLERIELACHRVNVFAEKEGKVGSKFRNLNATVRIEYLPRSVQVHYNVSS